MNKAPEMIQLLTSNDPAPVEWVNEYSSSPVLLLCEHAGQAVPANLDFEDMPRSVLNDHMGWDIGAEAVARLIAEKLNAPLIIQRYSRLVMDCNRPPEADGAMPIVSDGVSIPWNNNLSANDRLMREREIFQPLNDAIEEGFAKHKRKAAFSIHSFTKAMQGQIRPWHAGFLSRKDLVTSAGLIDHIKSQQPDLNLSLNEPYQIDDESDWFIPKHAEARDMDHSLIEIRNDQLRDNAGINFWADLLANAIHSHMEKNT